MLRRVMGHGVRPLDRRTAILLLGGVIAVYVLLYLANPNLPGNQTEYPLGWWGWWDQGQYLRSAIALRARNFAAGEHNYPPLWALLATPFVRTWPKHPFFVIIIACLILHLWALWRIGTARYGWPLTLAVLVTTVALAPTAVVLQWVIPWNSSATAAAASTLFLIFYTFESREQAWRVETRSDWGLIVLFYGTYGAVFAIRPLDVFSLFPIALVFAGRVALAQARDWGKRFDTMRVAKLVALVGFSGALIPLGYLLFNTVVFGAPLAGYFKLSLGNGYVPSDIPRKIASLWNDGGALYLEPTGTMSYLVPLFVPALGVVAAAVIFARGTIAVIALTVITHLLVYLPYSDLVPNNILRFYVVHYFKWTVPWIYLIALGQLATWVVHSRREVTSRWALLVAALAALLLWSWRMPPSATEVLHPATDPASRRLSLSFANPLKVDGIDLVGVRGSYDDWMMKGHEVFVDGVKRGWISEYRFVDAPWGSRLVFHRPVMARRIEVGLSGTVTVPADPIARVISIGYRPICAIRSCDLDPVPLAVRPDQPLQLEFNAEGVLGAHLDGGWHSGEAWGRWTRAKQAGVFLKVDTREPLRVSIEVNWLLGPKRPRQSVRLLAEGCVLAEGHSGESLNSASVMISGIIEERCIPRDGVIRLIVESDRVVTPRAIGINRDERAIGVGVVSLRLAR
jgi:hypothetical protein